MLGKASVLLLTCLVFLIPVLTSSWVYSLSNVVNWHTAGVERLSETQSMLDRLARLSELAVHAYFIFDGPDRPQRTQETILPTGAVNLALRFQELLKIFGFGWHVVSCPCVVVLHAQPRLPRLQAKHWLSWPSST